MQPIQPFIAPALRCLSLACGATVAAVIATGLWWWLPGPWTWRWPVVVAIGGAVWWAGWWQRNGPWWWLARSAVLALCILFFALTPRTNDTWDPSQAKTIVVERNSDTWVIHHCRAARADISAPTTWESVTLDPATIDEMWLAICPFSPNSDLAHVFLSFGYRDSDGQRRYLAISPEIRRQRGERYDPIAGCFRRYELMYIVAREGDLIGLRTNLLGEDLRLYPLAVTPAIAQHLFTDAIARAEQLGTQPEWYHSLWNSCGSNLLRHGRAALDDPRLARSPSLLLPGRFDAVAWERGLLAVPPGIENLATLRQRYAIEQRARTVKPTRRDFSALIRTDLDR